MTRKTVGGRHLGRWAKQNWQSEVDEILLISLERAGSLPRMRLTGMLVGLKEVAPQLDKCRVTYLDGDGVFGRSLEIVRKHLRVSRSRRVLVGATNDPSALGALRAFQEAGRIASVDLPVRRPGWRRSSDGHEQGHHERQTPHT